MRILTISFALATVDEGAIGGAEQIARLLDEGLVEAGRKSFVVAASNSHVRGKLFGTASIPERIAKDYYAFRYFEQRRAIQEALDSEPVDLIHMHGFDFHEFIPEVDVPVLATLHLPPEWYPKWIYAHSRSNFYMNCVSASQFASTPKSPLIVGTIRNGVAVPPLEPLPCQEREGAVMLGRICPNKGMHIGIAAANHAGVPLVIAGHAFGYPEHVEYMQQQIEPKLNSRIRFVGPVAGERKLQLLRSAKCLLVASLVPETSSLVSMEALACGTPVIALKSGALAEVVDDGRTGFLVRNEGEMAEAMSRVDQINPEVCKQDAMERFSAKRMVREYLELYRELISRPKNAASPIGMPRAASQLSGTA